MQRWDDCRCEDFPCCGHYDTIAAEPEYCDTCGYEHSSAIRCEDDYDDDSDDYDDDEDAASIRGMANRVRVNAFGQRLRDDAEEIYGDRYEYDGGPFGDY